MSNVQAEELVEYVNPQSLGIIQTQKLTHLQVRLRR